MLESSALSVLNASWDNKLSHKNIAIAFFGITRSLRYTMPSIERNVLVPAKQVGDVSVYGHFFDLANVINIRSGEMSESDPDEYKLLNADWIQLSKPGNILEASVFEEIKSFGDHWHDDFNSVSNLLHQLYSLKTVMTRALQDDPDIVIFCRPDLEYHDSLQAGLRLALAANDPLILLPKWQRHKGGLNDRFAVCVGKTAAMAVGQRLDLALTFCRKMQIELHSERLLRYSLVKSGIPIRKLDVRASRVRADGRMVEENFSTVTWKMFRNHVRFRRMMRL